MKPKHLRCAVLSLAAAAPLNAEELRFDNAAQWRQWTLPLGIVELTPQGSSALCRFAKTSMPHSMP